MLPRHLRAHGLDEGHIGVVMGCFPLASLTGMLGWARVAERVSGRAALAWGMLLCGLGGALVEAAHGLPAFMATRALSGLGWSGVLVGASFLTTELAPPGKLAQALGAAGVLTLVAMALGPLAAELLVHHAGWPWVFRASAIACALGLALALRLPPVTAARPHERPAPAGAPSSAGRPIGALVLAALGFGAIMSFLADHASLEGVKTVSPFFHAYVITAVAARLLLGGLSDRLGRHPVAMPSLFGQAVALGGLAFLASTWQLVPLGALYGLTHGLYYPALQALVVERSAPERRGRAAAAGNLAFAVGMSVAAFGGGQLADLAGYPALYAGAGVAVLAAIALLKDDAARVKSRHVAAVPHLEDQPRG